MYRYNDGIPKPYFAGRELARLVDDVAGLGKRIHISEFNYANDPAGTTGRPNPSCPFSPEGQAAWVQDFLAAALARAEIERVFYFYPESFRGMHHGDAPEIESSGLFRSDHEVMPAARVFFR